MQTIKEIKKEQELIPIILNNSSIFGRKLLTAEQVCSGYGIADIVFYNIDNNFMKKRKLLKIEPIESYDLIQILNYLNKVEEKTISLTFLKEILNPIKNKREYIISFLINNGFLIKNSDENFKMGDKYHIGFKKVIAIEAKLSNWNRGLYQAYRYRQFANKSYLALYSKFIHRALANKEEFIKFNVGLIEVISNSKNGKIKIHIEPKEEKVQVNVFSAVVFENLIAI